MTEEHILNNWKHFKHIIGDKISHNERNMYRKKLLEDFQEASMATEAQGMTVGERRYAENRLKALEHKMNIDQARDIRHQKK